MLVVTPLAVYFPSFVLKCYYKELILSDGIVFLIYALIRGNCCTVKVLQNMVSNTTHHLPPCHTLSCTCKLTCDPVNMQFLVLFFFSDLCEEIFSFSNLAEQFLHFQPLEPPAPKKRGRDNGRYWARICKHSRSPGIDSASLYIACRAGSLYRVVVLARQAGNRLLGSLKVYKFGLRLHVGW